MWHSPATFILVLFSLPLSPSGLQGLTFDPDDYLEVYPDPRDDDMLQGRTPLYFSLIQSLGGPLSQFDASGSVAGVKIALDRINNDSSLLPGYTLHYTFANSKVCCILANYIACQCYDGLNCKQGLWKVRFFRWSTIDAMCSSAWGLLTIILVTAAPKVKSKLMD